MQLKDFSKDVQYAPYHFVDVLLRNPKSQFPRFDVYVASTYTGFIHFEHDPQDVFRRESLYPLAEFNPTPKKNGIGSMALYLALQDLHSLEGGPFTLSPGDVEIYDAWHVYEAVGLNPCSSYPLDYAISAFENYLTRKGRL